MSNRTIEAILRLSAKLGSMAAFKQLGGNLAKVDKQAKAYNRTQAVLARGARDMHATIMRYAAPAAMVAIGVAGAKSFATIERRMERIGLTAEASSAETVAALDRVRQIANDLRVPVDNVIEGLESLVASGKNLDEALAFLPSVAGTAHAADAAFGDMATTADAMGGSLDIAAAGMERAFDIIAKGGKAGKFELKDMASHLPSLAPAFAALGYKGESGLKRLVAALQTVRMETGSSGEAATSFMDILTKMESLTVTNNFKRFGIDIRKEMEAAKKSGEDTLEAFIRLSNKAVKGDLSKLPQLFTDKQMLIGMRAMMNRTQEFTGFMKELGDAAGTVRGDLARLGDDAQGSFDKLDNSFKKLRESIGKTLFDLGAGTAMDSLSGGLDYISAAKRGLEAKGVNGVFARAMWSATHDRRAKDGMAWVGGYRTDAQRRAITGYADYARSRREAGAAPEYTPPTETDRRGFPLRGPVPGRRPDAAPDFEAEYRRQQAGRPAPRIRPTRYQPGATHRDAERESMHALRSNPNEVADAIDEALSSGGRKAATSIAEGGSESGRQFGDAATAKLKSEAQAAGTVFGEAAASSFNRNARAPAARPGVSGDVGRSAQTPGEL